MPDLANGEKYHIQLPGAKALSTVVVMEVTVETVLLRGDKPEYLVPWESRYKRDDVEFVELVD